MDYVNLTNFSSKNQWSHTFLHPYLQMFSFFLDLNHILLKSTMIPSNLQEGAILRYSKNRVVGILDCLNTSMVANW